jgi:hypothetical protein
VIFVLARIFAGSTSSSPSSDEEHVMGHGEYASMDQRQPSPHIEMTREERLRRLEHEVDDLHGEIGQLRRRLEEKGS